MMTTLSFHVQKGFNISTIDSTEEKELYIKLNDFSSKTTDLDRPLQEMSACVRYKVVVFKRQYLFTFGSLFEIELAGRKDSAAYVTLNGMFHIFFEADQNKIQWNHFCMAFNKNNSLYFVVNGELLFDDLVGLPDLGFSIQDLNNVGLVLGFSENGRFKDVLANTLLQGNIREFYVWSKALSIDFMKKITSPTCQLATSGSGPVPDIFDIDNYPWKTEDINTDHVQVEQEIMIREETDMCKEATVFSNLLMPIRVTFDIAAIICKSLGGGIWYPESDQALSSQLESNNLFTSNPFVDICANEIWIGINKVNNAGTKFRTLDGLDPPPFMKWAAGQPNGRGTETCLVIFSKFLQAYNPRNSNNPYHSEKEFWDFACTAVDCFVCKMPRAQQFHLRGPLPVGCDIDRKYIYHEEDSNAMHFFAGYYSSIIYWSESQERWQVRNRFGQETVLGHVDHADKGYITGTQNWTLTCSPTTLSDPVNQNPLKLSQCKDDEFSCFTLGECLPIIKRCNGRQDCLHDMSDEEDCDIFKISAHNYQVRQPPNDDTTLNVEMILDEIGDFQELKSSNTVQFRLNMIWFEERLVFRNLEEQAESNVVPHKLREKLWLPTLYFANNDDLEQTEVDKKTTLSVHRLTIGLINDLEDLREDLLYPGNQNPFYLTRLYTVTFHCKFQLQKFPFDRQICPIQLRIPGRLKYNVKINMSKVMTDKDLEMVQYTFKGLKYTRTNDNDGTVEILITLERKWAMYMATTFLPTICLILICELTLFIDISHFEATIMVALTSMLVMYTLYQSVY